MIDSVEPVLVHAAPHTNWVFVEVRTSDGRIGTGEASHSGAEPSVAALLEEVRPALVGRPVLDARPTDLPLPVGIGAELAATLRSALDQALWDLRGRMLDAPLWRLLGGDDAARPPVYANVNRAAVDRSPRAMADLAARAVAQGFWGVKCAPFDGLTRARQDDADGRAAIDAAIERVRAIRAAIGPDARLMVDAHWRLTPDGAARFLGAVPPGDLAWLEDPFPEEAVDAWRALHRETGVRLAGGERSTSLRPLADALAAGQYQVCCPDVRHVGGVGALWHAAHLCWAHGAAFAPHNPRGPVGGLATAHVAAAAPDVLAVEHPFAECDWRASLVGDVERVAAGAWTLPDAPGLGGGLDREVAAAHPYAPVVPPSEASGVDIL